MLPDFYVDEAQPHLGGFIRGGDPATFYPQLWKWLVREHGVTSVLDVGCGEGHALDYFASLLCDPEDDPERCPVMGIDGVEQESPHIFQHDFTTGPAPMYDFSAIRFDLVWSCEFVEHVEEQYVRHFMETFADALKLVAMTHAEPGQPGYHHVNCRTADYWVGALAAVGFRLDEDLTQQARLMAGMNRNPINHFARSGLVFRAT